MNNEIKEILEIFKQVDLEPEAGGCYNCPKKDKDKTCIGCLNNAKDKLLDYITNLQQENERLKIQNELLKDQNINEILKKDLEICAKQYKKSDEKLEKYKSRIEKAIRILETLKGSARWERHLYEIESLLNILNGRSDE